MKKTIKHLMTPRFFVMRNFDGSEMEQELILEGDKQKLFGKDINPRDFPGIFRLMDWWDGIEPNNFPKYLKRAGNYYEVKKWIDQTRFETEERIHSLTEFKPAATYRPCSETEYLKNTK